VFGRVRKISFSRLSFLLPPNKPGNRSQRYRHRYWAGRPLWSTRIVVCRALELLRIKPSAGLAVPHAASLQTLSFATTWTYHTFVRSYACLVIIVLICCYAHVTSDDRSHISCVVDLPTTSTCPPPTMDFPCEVRSPFLSSFIRWSMLLRSCIWGARSRAPVSLSIS
jgi:hypothetical protein